MAGKEHVPEEMRAWLDMAIRVIARTGFPPGLNVPDLMAAFTAHNSAVKATIPADQLLVYQVRDGWVPLCEFLGVSVPDEPFPRTNDRGEFWDRVSGKNSGALAHCCLSGSVYRYLDPADSLHSRRGAQRWPRIKANPPSLGYVSQDTVKEYRRPALLREPSLRARWSKPWPGAACPERTSPS
jgi:hypothetical protein